MCRETDLRGFRPQLIYVDFRARRHVDNGSGKVEAVPGTDHRGECLLACRPVRNLCCEWPDPPSPGKADSGVHGLLRRKLVRRLAISLFDPSRTKRLAHPSPPDGEDHRMGVR